MRLITDNGLPYWEYPDGKRKLARRRDQFYRALKNQRARDELLELERTPCSQGQFLDACEHGWSQPGLSALQTVAAVRAFLGDLGACEETGLLTAGKPIKPNREGLPANLHREDIDA